MLLALVAGLGTIAVAAPAKAYASQRVYYNTDGDPRLGHGGPVRRDVRVPRCRTSGDAPMLVLVNPLQ